MVLCDVGERPGSQLLLGHVRGEVGAGEGLHDAFGRRGKENGIAAVVPGSVADTQLLQLSIALGLQLLGNRKEGAWSEVIIGHL